MCIRSRFAKKKPGSGFNEHGSATLGHYQDTERDRPVLGDHEDGDEVDDGQGQELRLLGLLYISAYVKNLCS
jgi:hypothetical protein